jgi:hypothetical protein
MANALEYSRTGDLRAAVVESVICLEIAASQVLPLLLREKGIPADALTKDITLSARVQLLLPLLLPQALAQVDKAAVVRTITWRNAIVHRSGNLAADIPQGKLREGISAVLALAHWIAVKREALAREPDLQALAARIAAEFGIPAPAIEWTPRHMFSVKVVSLFDPLPPVDRLQAAAQAIVDGILELEPRCNPNTALFIFFRQFLRDIATWQGGRFSEISRPPTAPVRLRMPN